MKLSPLFLTVACAAPLGVSAQYFSEGWKPGQATPTLSTTASEFVPSAAAASASNANSQTNSGLGSLLTNLLSSGPVASLLGSAGINVTERLASVQDVEIWDERIPLITDDNYKDVIVNEVFEEEEEEKNRVWFLIISVTTAQPQGISNFADEQFDAAFNITQNENDLPNVRWGRIDYINVTAITTKWNVWQAPMLVVLKDRGQTLRFWRATQLRLKPESMREFLRTEFYERTPPWKSNFAPGGSREFVLDYLAIAMSTIYNYMRILPRWAMYMLTGAFGSVLINFVHRGDAKKKLAEEKKLTDAKKQRQVQAGVQNPKQVTDETARKSATAAIPTANASASPSPSPAKKSGAKGKKGRK
ncbi:hypothetical protein EW146_g2732 [Bondarzewia mesenterica]|uniref:Thioredoxin domain-containing protein n=1 Tax=Bondarzewia mesenterica TaxID=1095465 RepID=A0A4V3XFN2_9AGAM|nr:hypothetical protein EW146_g2732 [Bondarzewia mesenterica]